MPAPIIKIAPHTEAAAIIRQKPILSQAVFNELLPELKSRAFVISGLEHFDTLQEVQDILATLPEGANWDDVKGQIIEKISPWFTPKAAERRAEFLLRTHGYQAYAVSNYRSLEESKDLFPFRQYLSSEDPRVRPAHAALHRRVFPSDSPFWNTHTPPWEWGCRCDAVGLTEEEAMEIKASDDQEKDAGKRLFMDGPLLESVENSNVLHIGNGHTFNVSTPFEKGSGYLFEPGSLHMNVTALAARYSPEVWSEFKTWAGKTKIDSLGKTVWQWLAKPVKWKPAKGPGPISQPAPEPAPEPEPVPEPAPAPAPLVLPANNFTIWQSPNTVPNAWHETLKHVQKLGGTTGAELKEDALGNRFVVKRGASAAHLRTEVMADEIYRAAGVHVPKPLLIETATGPVKVTPFIQGDLLSTALHLATGPDREAILHQARKHFLMDALLGNWDVAGQNLDNMLVDSEGKVWRIDNGGSLDFRAQGANKTASEWGDTVPELKTMRDAKKNPSAAKLFAGLTPAQLRVQLADLQAHSADILAAAGPHAARIQARMEDLARQLPAPAPRVRKPKAAPAAAPVPMVGLPDAATVLAARVVGFAYQGNRDLIEDNNVLVWEQTDASGNKILRAKLRLTAAGSDALVTKYNSALKGITPVSIKPAPRTMPGDTYWANLLPTIKHINYHASDGKYNTAKIAALQDESAKLKALNPNSPEEAAMIQHYLAIITAVQAAHAAKGTTGQFAQYEPPAPAAAAAPSAAQNLELKVSPMAVDWKAASRTNGRVRSQTGTALHQEPGYRLMAPDQATLDVIPWREANGAPSSAKYAFRGQAEITIPGGVTPENIARLPELLKQAGIEAPPATPEWTEQLYLRKHLEMNSYDLTAAQNTAWRAIADGPDDDAAKIAKLKDFATSELKWKMNDSAYQPAGRAGNSFGQGWRVWERADLPGPAIEKKLKGYGLTHESRTDLTTLIDSYLHGGGQVTNTTERLRLGIATNSGMSPDSDMGTGGANYFFTRIRSGAAVASHHGMVFKIGMLARMDAFSFHADRFGDVRPKAENRLGLDPREQRARTVEKFRNFSKFADNETIFKNGVSLLDDIDRIQCRSFQERLQIIDTFAKHKITTLPDGRRIEDIVTIR